MERSTISKNQIITQLTKSPHGKLDEYIVVTGEAAAVEPEFLAHLIAWNNKKGQIRDSKVALPAITLATDKYPKDFVENSLAHLATLSPRDFLRGLRFAKSMRTPGQGQNIKRLVSTYLRQREASRGWWDRTVVQHRATVKELYALYRVKPAPWADDILFKSIRPPSSIFAQIAGLQNLSPIEAAGVIITLKIPFQIALGALGAKAKNPDVVIALINRMTPAQLLNSTKMLEKLGIKTIPAVRAAYQQAIDKIEKGGTKLATLKASVAADAIDDDELKAKLQGVQERVIKNQAGIDGNWLVLADQSASQQQSIEVSKHIVATLATAVKGKVHLVFFSNTPRYFDMTGRTLEQIRDITKYVNAGGNTCMGCGLLYVLEKGIAVDGIAIISDGGENRRPGFWEVYPDYSKKIDKKVPVYLYRTQGDPNVFAQAGQEMGYDFQQFDIPPNIDYYSLPNLVQTMRTDRYGLVEEIMDTPLLSLENVFPNCHERILR